MLNIYGIGFSAVEKNYTHNHHSVFKPQFQNSKEQSMPFIR